MVKVVYLVLGVMLLMLGIVGLLFPLLPGVLFLALAAVLLAKASTRIAAFLDRQPAYHRLNATVDQMGTLAVVDRVRVTGLLMLRGALQVLDGVVTGVRRLTRR